jgi:hypothetical protein
MDMGKRNMVLVITKENDPQLAQMLQALPHVAGSEPAAFAQAARDATVMVMALAVRFSIGCYI